MIADLEILQQKLIASSPEKRTKLLNFVSQACRKSSSSINEQHMQMLAGITEALIESVDEDALMEAADTFAHIKNTPHSLIDKLARQNIQIAASVIENSTVLTDDDLVEIILGNGSEHHKHIVKRKAISSRVTDCLTEIADEEILEALLQNTGASFSEYGYRRLANAGLENDSIIGSLIARPDMPQDIANKLLEKLDVTGSGKLMEKDEKLRIKFGAQAIDAHNMRSQRDLYLPLAKTHISQISNGERSLDDCIVDLCTQGEDQALCQVIAAFTKVTESVIIAAFRNVSGAHILQYCKTMGVARETFQAIVTLRTKSGNLPDSQIFYLMRQFDAMTS